MTIDKTFDPAAIEARWYAHWETTGQFRPEREDREPFTIVIPPPNVTGSLHIGHALDNTLQDILVRHARLQGKDALWVVGTDHAGIATQMVVERQLASAQQKRSDFTREEFVEKVWAWKEESGGAITQQLRRLGASCDWANERFTMDEGFSKAVVKVFVDLYNQGLLYRDKRLVNWDPRFRTAISDLEVETKEVAGSFWHFRYPLADGVTLADRRDHIVVATTRPETMLADMAVAVNAADPRYASVIGKFIDQPITGRRIPIVADDHANPELGSGAVKITPGHDFNDFEVGKRAGFKPADMLNMFDADANVVQTSDNLVPAEFLGLPRFVSGSGGGARALVVQRMKDLGLLVPFVDKDGGERDAEPRTIQTPFGDRSGVVIEPWLTDQWYVDAKTLAGPAIEAVRSGEIRVVPETWKKTWYNWLENIQPWCVSRQLWWGHQIPAWYGAPAELYASPGFEREMTGPLYAFYDGHHEIAESESEAISQFAQYYGVAESDVVVAMETPEGGWNWRGGQRVIYRDSDVLDTWFSSALWPFATLGWPEDEPASSEPFVLSEVEGRAASDPLGARASTALSTNGEGGKRNSLLARHYPNDVLISGFDILFFWDARMAMQGLHFMGERPWKTLYLHGLVRDATGAKMSKSKGNVVDPVGLIDRYGADALRFTMAAMESQGRDIKLDEKRVEGYRNFATKLWNAARFAQSYGIGGSTTQEPPAATGAVDKWIVAETVKTVQALDLALADLRFDEAANTVYHFVWDRFCDWYLELIKPVLQSPSPSGEGLRDAVTETREVAGWVLDRILVMLHPFMPFLTEELWHALAEREHDLIVAAWPMADARALDPEAVAEVEWLIRLVGGIRAARAELNVPPGAKLHLFTGDASDATAGRLDRQHATLSRLARLESIQLSPFAGGGAAQLVVDEATFALPLEGVIDVAAEQARLEKAAQAAEKEAAGLAGRLGNPAFVEKAKPEAVAKAREDHAAKAAEAERLRAALARLG